MPFMQGRFVDACQYVGRPGIIAPCLWETKPIHARTGWAHYVCAGAARHSSGGRCLRSESQVERRGRPSAAGNAAISLVGAIAPALVALVAIPMLVRALGAELFGLLSFIWIVFG